jgi:hypothetical protein
MVSAAAAAAAGGRGWRRGADACRAPAAQGVASYVGGYDLLTGCRLGRVDVKSPAVAMCFSPDATTLVVATQVRRRRPSGAARQPARLSASRTAGRPGLPAGQVASMRDCSWWRAGWPACRRGACSWPQLAHEQPRPTAAGSRAQAQAGRRTVAPSPAGGEVRAGPHAPPRSPLYLQEWHILAISTTSWRSRMITPRRSGGAGTDVLLAVTSVRGPSALLPPALLPLHCRLQQPGTQAARSPCPAPAPSLPPPAQYPRPIVFFAKYGGELVRYAFISRPAEVRAAALTPPLPSSLAASCSATAPPRSTRRQHPARPPASTPPAHHPARPPAGGRQGRHQGGARGLLGRQAEDGREEAGGGAGQPREGQHAGGAARGRRAARLRHHRQGAGAAVHLPRGPLAVAQHGAGRAQHGAAPLRAGRGADPAGGARGRRRAQGWARRPCAGLGAAGRWAERRWAPLVAVGGMAQGGCSRALEQGAERRCCLDCRAGRPRRQLLRAGGGGAQRAARGGARAHARRQPAARHGLLPPRAPGAGVLPGGRHGQAAGAGQAAAAGLLRLPLGPPPVPAQLRPP